MERRDKDPQKPDPILFSTFLLSGRPPTTHPMAPRASSAVSTHLTLSSCHRSISANGTTLSERCLQNKRREAQSRGRVMEGKEKPLQTKQPQDARALAWDACIWGQRKVRSWDCTFPRAELWMRFIPPCLDVSRWVPQDTGRA